MLVKYTENINTGTVFIKSMHFWNTGVQRSGKCPNSPKFRIGEILILTVDYFSITTDLKNKETEAVTTEKVAVLQAKLLSANWYSWKY